MTHPVNPRLYFHPRFSHSASLSRRQNRLLHEDKKSREASPLDEMNLSVPDRMVLAVCTDQGILDSITMTNSVHAAAASAAFTGRTRAAVFPNQTADRKQTDARNQHQDQTLSQQTLNFRLHCFSFLPFDLDLRGFLKLHLQRPAFLIGTD